MSGGVLKWINCESTGCESVAAGRKVAVKLNVSGKAYYRCDDCGTEVKKTTAKGSSNWLQKLGIGVEPEPVPEQAEKRSESPPEPPPKEAKKSGGWVL